MSDQAKNPPIRERVFQRLWGVAAIAHLAGNAHGPDIWPDPTVGGFVLLFCGILASLCIICPSRMTFAGLCVAIPLSAAVEVPFLGNHWLLAAIVSLAWVASGGRWERFENAARMIVLTFYAFAAFAKLNAGFLDPATSCGLYYTNQMLTEFGLGAIESSSWFAWLAPWGAALIELSVVPLLLWRRTRLYGVMLAVGFHGFLTLDFGQHFYDFTSVLFALFILFAPDDAMARVESIFARFSDSRMLAGIVLIIGVATTIASVLIASAGARKALADITFLWWLPYLGAIWIVVARTRKSREIEWRPGPVAIAGVLVVALNGMTPYTEIKTTYGWNMYSNLVVVDGDSNHYVMPEGLTIRGGHGDLIEIMNSDVTALQSYAEKGYDLPWPSFRMLAQRFPEAQVTYLRRGERVEVERIGENEELMAPVPWWWKWFPLRSLHRETPDRCQSSALPGL